MVSRTTPDVDPEDFSRRLKISLSPSPRPSQSTKVKKLFNPHTDPILNISESGSTGASRLPPSSSNDGDERDTARHLFDHQKDDPIRFSVIARPQQLAPGHPSSIPKSSRDHVSASSTSSYATSISSNSSTSSPSLSSDESSTSSLLFDGRPNRDRAENGIFALQVKKLYREISNLETKVMQENSMNDSDGVMSSRVVLKVENDDLEKEKWRRQICLHKMLVFFPLGDTSYLNRIQLPVWPKTSIICLKFPRHLLSRHLCESSRPNITSLFVYGPTLSTNYLNPSTLPLFLPHWLWNISRTLYITPTYFTQVFLKNQHSSPLNLDGWKLLVILLGIGWL